VPSIKRLAKTAEKHGITIIIESVPHQIFPQIDDLEGLIREVNSPNLKMSMNTANIKLLGQEPSEVYSHLMNKGGAGYVHLSNYKPFSNGNTNNNYSPLADGEIPVSFYSDLFKKHNSKELPCSIYMLSNDPFNALKETMKGLRK
jgi:sugar phosphate isomerase/epimerase